MQVSQTHNNYPISFIAETIIDGIKIGIMIEKFKKKNVSCTLIMEGNEIKGIKIRPDELVNLLT